MDAMSPNPNSVVFSPDQIQALIGTEAQPGEEITLTLRAGDLTDGGQSFEVVPSEPAVESELAPQTDNPAEESVEPPQTTPEESSEGESPAAPAAPTDPLSKALGYDRPGLLKAQGKKQAPKLTAKDLQED